MILVAVLLTLLGLAASAFFSGSETGLYRATRLRLVLDAMAGSRTAKGLLWLVNRPAVFVATTLIGNNLANYLTSLGVVLGTQALTSAEAHGAEIVASLLLAPVLFVYGELVPKNLFLSAPNRLLRKVAPLLLVATVALLPASSLLWAWDQLLQRLLRYSPERVRATLARRELRRVVEEGQEAGILRPVQRAIAQNLFALANEPVTRFLVPAAQLPRGRSNMSKAEVLRLAQGYRVPVVPLGEVAGSSTVGGAAGASVVGPPTSYVRVIELAMSAGEELSSIHPLMRIAAATPLLAALMTLESAAETIAAVVDDQGHTLGLVSREQLLEPLFQTARAL